MQCTYCKGQDLSKLSYDYYECNTCGKLNYVDKQLGRKRVNVSELYFAIGIGAVVLIVTILILLYFTAADKRVNVNKPVVVTGIVK